MCVSTPTFRVTDGPPDESVYIKTILFLNEFLHCRVGKKGLLCLLVLGDFCVFLNFRRVDQSFSSPAFGLFNNISSNSIAAANRASGSTLDSSNSLSWAPAAAAVPGQDTAVSSSALINSAGPRTAQPSAPSHVTTPVTTSNTGKAVTPFVLSSGDSTINTAMFANNLGATTIPGANGTFMKGKTYTCVLCFHCL